MRHDIYRTIYIIAFLFYYINGFALGNDADCNYSIYADNITAKQGDQITLKLKMKNVNAVTLWQTDLRLPDGITIAKDQFGDPMVSLSGNRTSTSRHSIGCNMISNNTIRILCSSQTNLSYSGNDGEIASITLNVSTDIKSGTYEITTENTLVVESSEVQHLIDDNIINITIGTSVEGDADGNGVVDLSDIKFINEITLGSREYNSNCDFDNNGIINILDIVKLVQKLINK